LIKIKVKQKLEIKHVSPFQLARNLENLSVFDRLNQRNSEIKNVNHKYTKENTCIIARSQRKQDLAYVSDSIV